MQLAFFFPLSYVFKTKNWLNFYIDNRPIGRLHHKIDPKAPWFLVPILAPSQWEVHEKNNASKKKTVLGALGIL